MFKKNFANHLNSRSKRTFWAKYFCRKVVHSLKQWFWIWKWIFWQWLWSKIILIEMKKSGQTDHILSLFGNLKPRKTFMTFLHFCFTGGGRETGVSIAMEIRISGQGWVWALASHTLFSVEEEKRIANKFSPDSNHLPWNNPKRFAKKLGSHRIILYLRNVRNVFRFVGLDNRPWIIGYVLKIVSFRQSEGKYLCEAHTGKTSFQSVTLNA